MEYLLFMGTTYCSVCEQDVNHRSGQKVCPRCNCRFTRKQNREKLENPFIDPTVNSERNRSNVANPKKEETQKKRNRSAIANPKKEETQKSRGLWGSNRAIAFGLLFGAIGGGIGYLIVGKNGWQVGVGFWLGAYLGHALIGDLDSNEVTPVSKAKSPSAKPVIDFQDKEISALDKAILLNNQGWEQSQAGNLNSAMGLWTESALGGIGNALGNFTWYSLREERYDDAISLHEECISSLKFANSPNDIAKFKSNYALNLLAKSGDIQKSKEIWISNSAANDPESRFYAALAALLQGNQIEYEELIKKVSADDLDNMRKILFKEKISSKGWFKDWCSKGLDLINDIRK
jgi:tetratricopeptide (TPR) repeat protein